MSRFVEIDLVRGLAVLGMILFHFLFDLNFLGIYPIDLSTGRWFLFARTIAFMFVFLAGISCVLFYHRKGKGSLPRLRERGILIFLCGMAITLVTYLIYPDYTILFGALHLIGLGIFLSPFFIHRPIFSLAFGLILVGVGILFSIPPIAAHVIPVTGVFPYSFSTFDYLPVFPWLGVFLIGMWAGKTWYTRGRASSLLEERPIHPVAKHLQWIGQHSLAIYLVHQPILLALLSAWMLLIP